jgi:peptide/nickel transport system substrate-binding protein
MKRGFFQSMVGILLLAGLLLVTVINVWQSNRIEKNQISLLKRLKTVERTIESGDFGAAGGSGGPSGGIWGAAEPDYVTKALQDPSNFLKRDTTPWLPADAQQGGTLHLALGSDPKGFNFLVENGADVSMLQRYSLVQLAEYHKKDVSQFGPELAYHWEISEDKKTHTFKLRKDIYWQKPTVDWESGRFDWLKGRHQVTARDLVFMFDMMMNTQVGGAAPARSYYSELESYRAIDDFTFEVKLKTPKYMNVPTLASVFPVPEFLYAYDEAGERFPDEIIGKRFEEHWYSPNALGAGPYQITKYQPGVAVELERDPKFPLGGNAFDKIVFSVIKDQTALPRKLRTKELHLSGIAAGQYRAEVLEGKDDSPFKDGTLQAGEHWSYSYTYIGWNMRRPMFSDKRVRQALSHAFPAQKLLDDVWLGLGERVSGPMPTVQPMYNKSVTPIPYDLDKARALLDEAGWTDTNDNGTRDKMIDGVHTEFEFTLVLYGSSNEYKTLGTIYKEDLAKIGVTMIVAPNEWANLLKKIQAREFDAVTLAWISGPPADFRQIWHGDEADKPKSSNHVGFNHPEGNRLIEALETEFNPAERERIAHEFHALVADEQPYTFFRSPKSITFWQPELKNVWFQLYRPHRNPRPFYLSQ